MRWIVLALPLLLVGCTQKSELDDPLGPEGGATDTGTTTSQTATDPNTTTSTTTATSTTQTFTAPAAQSCPASSERTDGALIRLENATWFVGRCMSIVNATDPTEPYALRKVPPSGEVYLPLFGEGRYYVEVNSADADAYYCVERASLAFRYAGDGLHEATAPQRTVCQ